MGDSSIHNDNFFLALGFILLLKKIVSNQYKNNSLSAQEFSWHETIIFSFLLDTYFLNLVSI